MLLVEGDAISPALAGGGCCVVTCSGWSWAAMRPALDRWSELEAGTVTGAGDKAVKIGLQSACVR